MNYYQQQLQLVRQQAYPPGEICRRLAAARRFMDEHYAEPIRLDQVARSAWCSRFIFFVFQTALWLYSAPIPDRRTVGPARTLLKTGSQAPEICRAVGFSTSSFKSLFKNTWPHTGGLAAVSAKAGGFHRSLPLRFSQARCQQKIAIFKSPAFLPVRHLCILQFYSHANQTLRCDGR